MQTCKHLVSPVGACQHLNQAKTGANKKTQCCMWRTGCFQSKMTNFKFPIPRLIENSVMNQWKTNTKRRLFNANVSALANLLIKYTTPHSLRHGLCAGVTDAWPGTKNSTNRRESFTHTPAIKQASKPTHHSSKYIIKQASSMHCH